MKKFFSLLLSVVFVALLATAAFAAPATADGTEYNFVEGFGPDMSDTCFSFAARKSADGTMHTTSTYYDGTNDAIKSASHEQKMTGYRVNDTDTRVDVHKCNNDIIWYPNGGYENIIVFTAPVAGKYTYDFSSMGFWGYGASAQRYYVEVNGEVKQEATFAKDADPSSAFTANDTVTLAKGETIYFVLDFVDIANGDNGVINSLKVTLVEATKAPATSDAAVSIAAAIAAASIVGLAIVIKKH